MARTAFLVTSALAVAALGIQVPTAYGGHSWNNYHWARGTTTSVTLEPVSFVLRHNLASQWENRFLEQAKGDWTTENEIEITSILDDDSGAHQPGKCENLDSKYTSDSDPDLTIEVCSDTYGSNGWLGIALAPG